MLMCTHICVYASAHTRTPDSNVHLVPSYPFTSDSLPIAQPVHKHAIVTAGWPCDSVWPAGFEKGEHSHWDQER